MPLEDELVNLLKGGGRAGKIILYVMIFYWIISSLPNFTAGLDAINREANSVIYYIDHKELSNKDLRQQSIELANNLFAFAGERIINDPIYNNIGEINHSKWNENVKNNIIYGTETINIYNKKYLNDVVRIRQEFLKRNLTDNDLDQFYVNPANPLGIRTVAERLSELTNRLP
jgi:hypothetical protein